MKRVEVAGCSDPPPPVWIRHRDRAPTPRRQGVAVQSRGWRGAAVRRQWRGRAEAEVVGRAGATLVGGGAAPGWPACSGGSARMEVRLVTVEAGEVRPVAAEAAAVCAGATEVPVRRDEACLC